MTAPWETYVGAAADADILLDVPAISGLLGDLRQQAAFVTVDDPSLVFDTETGDTQLDVVAGRDEHRDPLRKHLKPLVGRSSAIKRLARFEARAGGK
jgi:hypothetical protein